MSADLRTALLDAVAPPDPTVEGLDEVRARGAHLARRRWAARVGAPLAAAAVVAAAVVLPGDATRLRTAENGPASPDGGGFGVVAGDGRGDGDGDGDGTAGGGRSNGKPSSAHSTTPNTKVTLLPSVQPPPGAVSPDSSVVAFLRDADVFTMNADGSNVRRLTSSGEYAGHLSWTPDGTRLLGARRHYSSEVVAPRTVSDLYFVDVASGAETRLTSTGDVASGTLSPDGRWIIYAKIVTGSGGIGEESRTWIMHADGTGARSLSGVRFGGDWSPDGSRFASGCVTGESEDMAAATGRACSG